MDRAAYVNHSSDIVDILNDLSTKSKAQSDETRHAKKNEEHNFALQSLEDLLTTVGTGGQELRETQGGDRHVFRFIRDVKEKLCCIALDCDTVLKYTAESPDKEKTNRFQKQHHHSQCQTIPL